MDGQVIAPSKSYPVTGLPLDDPQVDVGQMVLFPKIAIPEDCLDYVLPNGRRFEKHRVFWAGMLRDAWLRIE
jgi:hypothetical protein